MAAQGSIKVDVSKLDLAEAPEEELPEE
jgi:hypothetical protein